MIELVLGVRMDKQIIFEDDHIRAIYLQGDSDTLVLSFGDLISRAKGLSINAEKSLMKYNYAVVGIMPKTEVLVSCLKHGCIVRASRSHFKAI